MRGVRQLCALKNVTVCGAYVAEYSCTASTTLTWSRSRIAGTAFGRVGEIGRTGTRLYVDATLRGTDNTITGTPISVQGKDASVWALDLAP